MGDDDEKAIAGLLGAHRHLDKFDREGLSVSVSHVCSCGEWTHPSGTRWPDSHRAHVASVIAAHMADELTALRQRVAELAEELRREEQHHNETLDRLDSAVAERDALRERLATVERISDGYRDRLAEELRVLDAIRVLADAPGSAYVRASDLRAALGDA